MSALYRSFQSLADTLLTVGDESFGQSTDTSPINLLVRTDVVGATNIDEPVVTFTPTRVKGVSRGVIEKRDGQSASARANKVFLIYANDVLVAPRNVDRIEQGSEEYAIVDVEPIPNGEIVSVYKILASR